MNKDFPNIVKEFSNEVKFQVGERVSVDLPDVPVEQRDTTSGIITNISTRFHHTPHMRKIAYTIHFDNKGSYIKKRFALFSRINTITVEALHLTKCTVED